MTREIIEEAKKFYMKLCKNQALILKTFSKNNPKNGNKWEEDLEKLESK